MDLVERYVNAVKPFLPKAQQEDITLELAANIRAEMDDRADALGRPLSEAEQEALLHAHGHPVLVAERYQMGEGGLVFGRRLIGRALFPFYLRVLLILIGVAFAIHVLVLMALSLARGTPITFGGTLGDLASQLVPQTLWTFATVTAVFVVVDAVLPTLHWGVRSLPTVIPPRRGQASRLESLAEIIVLSGIAIGLVLAYNDPALLVGPVASVYHAGPIWQRVVLPAALVFIISIGRAVANLVRPEWVRPLGIVRILTDIAGLGIVLYLALGRQWVVLAAPTGDSSALDAVNELVRYSLSFTAAGFVVVTVMDAWKLARSAR